MTRPAVLALACLAALACREDRPVPKDPPTTPPPPKTEAQPARSAESVVSRSAGSGAASVIHAPSAGCRTRSSAA